MEESWGLIWWELKQGGKVGMSQRREVGANYFNTMLSQSYKNIQQVIKNDIYVKNILLLYQENCYGKNESAGNVDFMFSLLVNFGI